MKNNKILRSFTVLLTALVFLGGFSLTAYAGGGDEESPTLPNNGDYHDELNNEPTEPTQLTPDGNMELVDDIEGEAAEDKQFIVVQSKGGNYFYIVIDRAAENENSVHFLNQVDEADLMAIIEDGQTEEVPPSCICDDKCTPGDVNTACPVCSVNMSECEGVEAEPPAEETEQQEENGGIGGLVVFLVVGLIGGGGALYYFKILKPKQDVKGSTDIEDFDFDEYDDEETDNIDE